MRKECQRLLLDVARQSIGDSFGQKDNGAYRKAEQEDELTVKGPGAFVTLHEKGNLRGCIGYLVGDRPLCQLVDILAKEAAFQDYRFPQLEAEELPLCDIEISVLSMPKEIGKKEDIVLGRDGVILTVMGRRAVFLPQVATEQQWDLTTMLENLSMKAGLPPDAYLQSDAKFMVFQAEVFGEKDAL